MLFLRRFTSLAVIVATFSLQLESADAAGISWRTDLKKAAQESERTGKPILLQFTAEWCGYCHKMLKETFTDKAIAKEINDCFIPVVLDADEHEQAVEAVGIEAFPTTVIISSELNVIGRIQGFHHPPSYGRLIEPFCTRQKKAVKQATADARAQKTVAKPVSAEKVAEEKPAFGGLCLVSILKDRHIRKGVAKLRTSHSGRTLLFASEQHRREFISTPAKFLPLADGNCPVATVRGEAETEGDAATVAVYRSRIVLFRSLKHRADFSTDPRGFVRRLEEMQSARR